jgi:hypothetical protein
VTPEEERLLNAKQFTIDILHEYGLHGSTTDSLISLISKFRQGLPNIGYTFTDQLGVTFGGVIESYVANKQPTAYNFTPVITVKPATLTYALENGTQITLDPADVRLWSFEWWSGMGIASNPAWNATSSNYKTSIKFFGERRTTPFDLYEFEEIDDYPLSSVWYPMAWSPLQSGIAATYFGATSTAESAKFTDWELTQGNSFDSNTGITNLQLSVRWSGGNTSTTITPPIVGSSGYWYPWLQNVRTVWAIRKPRYWREDLP